MFKPNSSLGAVVKSFKKTNSGDSNSNFRIRKIPRVVKILEVFPSTNGDGYFIAKDLKNDKKLHVTIDKKLYDEQKQKEKKVTSNVVKFDGWLIDERIKDIAIAQDMPYFILPDTAPTKKREVIDGEEIIFISCGWLRHLEDYVSEKVLTGFITASAFSPYSDTHVQYYQHWRPTAIPIDNSDETSEILGDLVQDFNRIAQELKTINEEKEKAEKEGRKLTNISYPIRKGFQMRTWRLGYTKNANGDAVRENVLVDRYVPLFLQYPEQDEFGNAVGKSMPITGEWFVSFISAYADWAYEEFTKQSPDTYDLQSDNPKFPEDILVEVIVFDDLMATNLSDKNNRINIAEGKLFALDRMVRKETKPSSDSKEEDYYQGRALSAYGIIELANDKPDPKTKSFVARNYVKRVHLTSDLKDINYNIPCSLGGRTVIPENLLTKEELERKERYKNGFVKEQHYEEIVEEEGLFDEDIL